MENVTLPKSWKKINSKVYDQIGVVSDDSVKCIGSYAIREKGKIIAINFYDYTKHKTDFLKDLDIYYDQIDELNELIDGNPFDEGYESTSVLTTLYHDYVSIANRKYYLSICKVLADRNYVYDIQCFAKGKSGIYSFDVSLETLDEKNLIQSVKDVEHVRTAIRYLHKVALIK